METILCLDGSGLAFADIADFEAASHGRVHHDFAGRLYFLDAVDSQVVQVRSAV